MLHPSSFVSFQANLSLRNIRNFHLIFWCGSFVERHSFRRVSGKLSGSLQKLYLSAKFPHQKISWKFSILRSVCAPYTRMYSEGIKRQCWCEMTCNFVTEGLIAVVFMLILKEFSEQWLCITSIKNNLRRRVL